MPQVNVTYRAPRGDDKVVEAFGHTFFDGKQETVEVDDHALRKLRGNPVFECSEQGKNVPGDDDPSPRDAPDADAKKQKAK